MTVIKHKTATKSTKHILTHFYLKPQKQNKLKERVPATEREDVPLSSVVFLDVSLLRSHTQNRIFILVTSLWEKTAKQMFFYESNIFQLMRRTNRRPLLLHLFPHRDITVCNKVLMSSRGHAVKLTIWRSLADSSWLAGSTQLCGETITNIVPVNYTEVGGGGLVTNTAVELVLTALQQRGPELVTS